MSGHSSELVPAFCLVFIRKANHHGTACMTTPPLPLGSGDENHWSAVFKYHAAGGLCRFSRLRAGSSRPEMEPFGATSTPATPPRRSEERSKPQLKGADIFVIANADTVMTRPTTELLTELFPDVPLKKQLGPNETLLSRILTSTEF